MKPTPATLAGKWRHSHEEDTGTATVYRRPDYDFPPARGRRDLELRIDGTFTTTGPGPTDRPSALGHGRWSLDDDMLELRFDNGVVRQHKLARNQPVKLVFTKASD